MSRFSEWRDRRRQQRVSSDVNYESQRAVWWLLAFFTFIFAVMIVWALFLGGRYLYREYIADDQPATEQQAESDDSQSEQEGQAAPDDESGSEDTQEGSEQSGDDSQAIPGNGEESQEPGRGSGPTPEPSPAPAQVPNTGPGPELPHTGPTEE